MKGCRIGHSDGQVFMMSTSEAGKVYFRSTSKNAPGAASLSPGAFTPEPPGMWSTRMSILGATVSLTTSMAPVTMFRLEALRSFTKSQVCWNSKTPPRPQISPAGAQPSGPHTPVRSLARNLAWAPWS